jgi:hypothetical protein
MRKLREAAVVAAMVGSVSMLGAGIAAAGGEEPQELPTVECSQDASSTDVDLNFGGTVGVPAGGGDADASATQQTCGLGNDENENTAGEATGAAGAAVL